MRLLVTRAEADARRTADALKARGHEAVIAPLIEIRPIVAELPERRLQAVLATSAHAIEAAAGQPEIAELYPLPLLAVGEHTAEAARQAGFIEVLPAGGDAEDLIRLVKAYLRPEGGPLLHLSGRHIAVDLSARLEPSGFELRRAIVYEAVAARSLPPAARAAIAGNQLDGILVYSMRSARILLDLVRRAGLLPRMAQLRLHCLSAAVAAPFTAAGLGRVAIAERPEENSLLDTIGRS